MGWLGNPAWWRETLPRLAHYYTLSTNRRGALPDIQIIYFGQTYEYTLPWHNAWVLLGITVPVTILLAAAIGIVWALGQVHRDQIPLYFLLHFLTLPVLRMLPTPAHDGVRLFLPTFFFLAAFAGWGTLALARDLSRHVRLPTRVGVPALAALILAPAAIDLARIHPFELSYYNAIIGGPRGAWHRGFELTYWFDAFNEQTLAEINQKLPAGAEIDFPNELTNPMTFQELQSLGGLRSDLRLGGDVQFHARRDDQFPYVWLQTQDSKATAFSRLLFAMKPWYAREPRQLEWTQGGDRRRPGGGLSCLGTRGLARRARPDDPRSAQGPPPGAEPGSPRLGPLSIPRGCLKPRGSSPHTRALNRTPQPGGWSSWSPLIPIRRRSRSAGSFSIACSRHARRLWSREFRFSSITPRPWRDVMTRYGYTDPAAIGGFLDRDLPAG